MATLTLNEGTLPSTPAARKHSAEVDSSDHRLKQSRFDGTLDILTRRVVSENYLINGGFYFAQRQAPGTATTYSNTSGRAYAADRWGITNENASVNYSRVDASAALETGLSSRFYGKFAKITSAGKIIVSQVIEGSDVMPLRGRNVRVQALMKFGGASLMQVRLGLLQLTSSGTIDTIPATFVSAFGGKGVDPTWGANLSPIAPQNAGGGVVVGNGLTCTLSPFFQRFSAVFTVPSNCLNLIAVIWSNAQLNVNDEIHVSEVGLYDGESVLDWSPRPIAQVLAACQRFYCKTFNADTNPAQNAGVNTGEFRFIAGKAGATAENSPTYFFPVSMRAAPATRTTYNPAAANAQVRDITAAVDCSAAAIAGVTERGAYVTATGNTSTAVGNHLGVHLSFNAEL